MGYLNAYFFIIKSLVFLQNSSACSNVILSSNTILSGVITQYLKEPSFETISTYIQKIIAKHPIPPEVRAFSSILSLVVVLVVVGIIVTIVCVSSSNSIAKKMKKATESVKNVTKVTTVYSVKDGEELVYNNEQVVSIDETGTADVVTNESKLNSKFVLEAKTSVNTIENFKKAC